MPDLKDPQKQIPVSPRFFLAEGADPVPAGLTVAEKHELVASYITGQDNPWFAKAFVNRIWAVLIGEGFYEPDRRHGAGPGGPFPRSARGAGLAMAAGGLRCPVALPHDPQHQGLPAQGTRHQLRLGVDALRGELPQPAPLRPDPRGAVASPGRLVRWPGEPPAGEQEGREGLQGRRDRTAKARQAGRHEGLPASEPARPVQCDLRLRPVPVQR